jgi:hypothetical protein
MSKGYSRSIRRPIGVPGASWAVVDQRKRLWTVPELWKTQTARFPQARWTAQRTRRPQRPTRPLAFTNDGPRRKMTRPFTTGKAHTTSEGGRYVISPPVSAATRNGRLSSVVQWPVLSCPRRSGQQVAAAGLSETGCAVSESIAEAMSEGLLSSAVAFKQQRRNHCDAPCHRSHI